MTIFIYTRSSKAIVQPLALFEPAEAPPAQPFFPAVRKEVRVGSMRVRTLKTFPIISGLMFVPEDWRRDDPGGSWELEYRARPMWRWDLQEDDTHTSEAICTCKWKELQQLWDGLRSEPANPRNTAPVVEIQPFLSGDRVEFLDGLLCGYEGTVIRQRGSRVFVDIKKWVRPVECEYTALRRL